MIEAAERAPVQGCGHYHLPVGHSARAADAHPPGTVAWWEHQKAWEAYAQRYGQGQSAKRIAERHGFSYDELRQLLGHEPVTWEPVGGDGKGGAV